MDQDPCGDLEMAPCEVKLRWEAGAFPPGTSAHGLGTPHQGRERLLQL